MPVDPLRTVDVLPMDISPVDMMANLCKPITAYDFHVRYNKFKCHPLWMDGTAVY